jgi:parallel beta-helix repeat protein
MRSGFPRGTLLAAFDSPLRKGSTMRLATVFLLPVLLLGLAAPAAADTFTVSPGGALPTIQSGLDAANPGDAVLVLAGTYVEDFVNTKSAILVKGIGDVVVVGNGLFQGAKKCLFSNFTINGSLVGLDVDPNSHGNVFSNLTVTTTGTTAIWVRGNRNAFTLCSVTGPDAGFEVDGSFNAITRSVALPGNGDIGFDVGGERNLLASCLALGTGGDGFDVGGRANVVTKCAASGCADAGIRAGGNGGTYLACAADQNVESGMTIEGDGNTVQKCRFGFLGGNVGPGVAFDGAGGNLLSGCLVMNNGANGIDLGSLGNANDNRIERNRVVGNTGDGILLSSSNNADDNWVERNVVTGNTGAGISAQSNHNVIVKNRVSGNGGNGLDDTGVGNYTDGNK